MCPQAEPDIMNLDMWWQLSEKAQRIALDKEANQRMDVSIEAARAQAVQQQKVRKVCEPTHFVSPRGFRQREVRCGLTSEAKTLKRKSMRIRKEHAKPNHVVSHDQLISLQSAT